jgi:hypothetical protein
VKLLKKKESEPILPTRGDMRQAHETLNKRCLGGNPEASSWRDDKQALLGRQPKEYFPAFCIFNSINAINSSHIILLTTF